jgi:HK97 family phage portal protein
MGLVTRLLGKAEQSQPAGGSVRAYPLAEVWLGTGGKAKSGVRVSEESALTYSAVWACVRIISESAAMLPLHLMRREGRAKVAATEHPLFEILHSLANPEQTAMEFRQMLLSQVLLWGTAFAEKEYDKRGNVVALWPLLSRRMEATERRPSGRWWAYRLPDQTLRWIHQDYLHLVRGLSGDGVWGYSPIQTAAMEAVGLGLATEEFGGRFFGNGAHLGGILEHPGRLSDDAHQRLTSSISESHGGLSQAHRLKILEEGMRYQSVGIPPDAAQFLETRKFQLTEIARIYRVPPHMLADLERATFSNVEHLGQEFVTYTLQPWLVAHEQAIYRDLLDPSERVAHFARYNVGGLLRGDIATRYQAYNTGIVAGFMTRNEARALEDWNPIDGLDAPLLPLNMAEGGERDDPAPALPTLGREPIREGRAQYETRAERVRVFGRYVRLFEETSGRVVRREVADIRRAVQKYLVKAQDVDGFRDWLTTFYAGLGEAMPDYFRALLETYAEQVFESVGEELDRDAPGITPETAEWLDEYLANFSQRYTIAGESVLRGDVNAAPLEELPDKLGERLERWEEGKAAQTGMDQAFEAGNALALLGYLRLDVETVVWEGGDCPLCAKLNGTRQAIGQAFVEEGDTVEAEDGATAPLQVKRTLRHGPLHSGCDCTVRAG